jgi:hypothetical protein
MKSSHSQMPAVYGTFDNGSFSMLRFARSESKYYLSYPGQRCVSVR